MKSFHSIKVIDLNFIAANPIRYLTPSKIYYLECSNYCDENDCDGYTCDDQIKDPSLCENGWKSTCKKACGLCGDGQYLDMSNKLITYYFTLSLKTHQKTIMSLLMCNL